MPMHKITNATCVYRRFISPHKFIDIHIENTYCNYCVLMSPRIIAMQETFLHTDLPSQGMIVLSQD